ncbi:MAG: flagellar biosynthesis protein FlhB [Rhizobiaceae bacterium]
MSTEADKDSKTEEPTEKKIKDAIEKGQLPVSKELPILVSILSFLLVFVFYGPESIFRFSALLGELFDRADARLFETTQDVVELVQTVSILAGSLLLPVFAVLILGGLVSSFSQNMPRLVGDRIAPKLSRISLKKGWERQFGAKGFAEFLKSVGKLGFATLFVVFAMWNAPETLLKGTLQQTTEFANDISSLVISLLTSVCLAMAIIAGADLLWSRYMWRQELRMTKQEVKDELKQAEGDPIVKARVRSVAKDRSRQRMMNAVPSATLVVANPTHYAIALRYDDQKDTAPVVVAKGQDLIALRIREIASENDVPVFEDKALARSMYSEVQVDQQIPVQFFRAVAELIKVLYANQSVAQTL